jgi:hypothetical protein
MAEETDPGWIGAGAILEGRTTVANILAEAGIEPGPERDKANAGRVHQSPLGRRLRLGDSFPDRKVSEWRDSSEL